MAYLRGQVVSGSSFYTGSQTISGSLVIDGDPATSEFFIVKSGSAELLKTNSDGLIQFHIFEDSYTPPVSLGAIFFHSSSAYLGLDD